MGTTDRTTRTGRVSPEVRVAEDFLRWERELTLPGPPRLPLWANRWEAVGIVGTWAFGPLPLILVLLL